MPATLAALAARFMPAGWVLYAAAAASIFAAGAWSGHSVTSNAWQADQARIEAKAIADYKTEAAKAASESAKLEERKDEIRTVVRTVTKTVDRIVDRPVYSNVCFDDDGLRAVNDVIAGKAPIAGRSDAPVPAAHAP